MSTKTIKVPLRYNGYFEKVINLDVEWVCPICGKEMGEPETKRFCEDGEFYEVDTWENPCGHVTKYVDLIEKYNKRLED